MRKRGFKDDSKDSGLSDWKGGVTVFLRLAAGATVWGGSVAN